MNIQFIKSSEKRSITEELNQQFGITNLPYLLIRTGKEKIRGFSGSLSKEEIMQLSKSIRIELIGLYMMKKEQDFRLTMDATHLLKSQISKNITKISKEQLSDWLHGKDLEIQTEEVTKIIEHQADFIGCGKSNGKKIYNYLPKERRLKN